MLRGGRTGWGRAMEGAKPHVVTAAWEGHGFCPVGTQNKTTRREMGNVTRLTRFFTHGCRLAPLGSMEGPNAGSANPHLPHLRPLQLCLDTVVHDLDSDLTV